MFISRSVHVHCTIVLTLVYAGNCWTIAPSSGTITAIIHGYVCPSSKHAHAHAHVNCKWRRLSMSLTSGARAAYVSNYASAWTKRSCYSIVIYPDISAIVIMLLFIYLKIEFRQRATNETRRCKSSVGRNSQLVDLLYHLGYRGSAEGIVEVSEALE